MNVSVKRIRLAQQSTRIGLYLQKEQTNAVSEQCVHENIIIVYSNYSITCLRQHHCESESEDVPS